MPRWAGSQARFATFAAKVRKMSKPGDGQRNSPEGQVPDPKPPKQAVAPDHPKRRPAKTRLQAWAKIDGGKGTWKPK
jgi:hypothetical protein